MPTPKNNDILNGSKKRTRSGNDEESPNPVSTKKQRVNGTTAASPSAVAVAANPDDSREGSLVNGEDVATTTRRSVLARVRRPTQKFAIEEVLTVQPKQTRKSQQTKPEIVPKKKAQPKGKLQISVPDNESSIYEIPDSGEDELSTAVWTPQPSPTKKKFGASALKTSNSASPAPGEDQPVKRKRGRPRKDQTAVPLTQSASASPAVTTGKAKPAKARVGKASDEEDEAAASLKVSKVRGRKTLVEDIQKPKGILTPSKRDGVRGRKSVAFSSMHSKDQVNGAPESPTSSIRKNKKTAAPAPEAEPEPEESAEEEEEEEEEDEEVCSICSKPDSKRGNQIMFCDSCNMAVHQKCYGVKKLPAGDWFCRDCSQENTTKPATKVEEAVEVVADDVPDIPNFDKHLGAMQRVLVDRCTGRRRIKLRGLDDVYEKAFQLVEQTIVAGEGNSMLVIGARGCGKTTLVETIVSDVSKEYKGQFHVVRLNGFIHTDDKLALREIWRQLGKEMEVEDELINKTNNYADTMASLLALLSHPSEIAADAQDGVTSKSVIFVIDEFDLFATHARQTLLYNLFDIAQAKKAPIAVLGLTTRIDVVESLEKRVKSRFSHRYVYLSLPKSLPAYWDICRQGLSVDDEDMEAEGIDQGVEGHEQFWKWWNEKIEALYKTLPFLDRLSSHFYTTKSITSFLKTCILPLSLLTPQSPSPLLHLSTPNPLLTPPLTPPDSKLHLLPSLSDLDLSMLIAAARLDIVAHTDTVNFAMAYDEYASLMGRQRVQSASAGMLALGGGARVWGRGVAGIAWERLVGLGLLVSAAPGGRAAAGGGIGGGGGGGGLDGKMWKVDVALEEIAGGVRLNAVLGRWCREI